MDDFSFLDHETEIHHSSPNNPMELQDQENDFQKKISEDSNNCDSTAKEMPLNVVDEIAKNVQEILVYHTKKESVDKSEEKFSTNVTETDSTDAKTADEPWMTGPPVLPPTVDSALPAGCRPFCHEDSPERV